MDRGSIKIEFIGDSEVSVTTTLADKTVWLTQTEIAHILGVFIQSVSANIRTIFKNNELPEGLVSKGINGIRYYNLDMFIALVFRCKGGYCRYFREWLREQAKKSVAQATTPQVILFQVKNSDFIEN